MACMHSPSHGAAEWAITTAEGDVEDRFLTEAEAAASLVNYPNCQVEQVTDPNPCGDEEADGEPTKGAGA